MIKDRTAILEYALKVKGKRQWFVVEIAFGWAGERVEVGLPTLLNLPKGVDREKVEQAFALVSVHDDNFVKRLSRAVRRGKPKGDK